MKTLFRIEAREFAPLVLFVLALQMLAFLGADGEELWILPGEQMADSTWMWWWILGSLLGYVHMGWDDLTRSRAYVRHRAVSARDLFVVRWSQGLTVALVWAVGPLLLHRAAFGLLSPNGPAGRWDRLPEYASFALVLPAAFAATGWAANSRGTSNQRLALGFVAAGAVAITSRVLAQPMPDEWARSAGLHALVMAGFVAVFGLATEASFRDANDLDRPLRGGRLVTEAGLVALVWFAVLSSTAPRFQDKVARGFYASAPTIARLEDGTVALVRGLRNFPGRVRCDAQGRVLTPDGAPAEQPVAVETLADLYVPWFHWTEPRDDVWERIGEDRRRFTSARARLRRPWELLVSDGRQHVYLDRHAGRVWHVQMAAEGFEASRTEVPGRAAPFSIRARVPGPLERSLEHPVLIGDPADGSAWLLAFADGRPALRELDLAGDRFVGWTEGADDDDVVVLGEAGRWRFAGGELVPYDGALGTRPGHAPYVASIRDPLRHTISVRDDAGRVVFTHEYRPRGAGARARAAWAYVLSAARAPVAHLLGHLGTEPEVDFRRTSFEGAWLVDPLTRSGKRTWLVLTLVAGWAVVAFACAAWLRERSGETARAVLWGLAIAAVGVPALVAFGSVETARAWRRAPTPVPAPGPALLIGARAEGAT